MKNIILAFTLLLSTIVSAQSSYTPENKGWMVSFDKAYAESQKTGKPIMANFTGSDWCGWCKKLTNDVFSKDDFKKWADENVILLELDFPRRKNIPEDIANQNASLRQAFQVNGFPTVWVFYANKDNGQFNVDPVTSIGYQKSSSDFTEYIDKFLDARKKKEGK